MKHFALFTVLLFKINFLTSHIETMPYNIWRIDLCFDSIFVDFSMICCSLPKPC